MKNNGVSYWGITLTIISLFLTTIKVIRCASRTSDRNNYTLTSFQNTAETEPVYNRAQEKAEIEHRNSAILAAQGRSIMYKDYNDIVKVFKNLEDYKINKCSADSTVYLDLSTKIKLKKGTLFYNNHDRKLKMTFKSADNVIVSVYDFDGKKNTAEEFERIKNDGEGQLETIVTERKKEINLTSYNFTFNHILYKGYLFASEDKGHHLYFTFESKQLGHKDLKSFAIAFFGKNLIKV